jgi:hypothetical protein
VVESTAGGMGGGQYLAAESTVVKGVVLEDVLEVGEALLDPFQAIESGRTAIISLEEGGIQTNDLRERGEEETGGREGRPR